MKHVEMIMDRNVKLLLYGEIPVITLNLLVDFHVLGIQYIWVEPDSNKRVFRKFDVLNWFDYQIKKPDWVSIMLSNGFHQFWDYHWLLNKLFIHCLNHELKLFFRVSILSFQGKLKTFRIMGMGYNHNLMNSSINRNILVSKQNIRFVDRIYSNKIMVFRWIIEI